ncbi:unnamed protein product, partial [marine sediment metagenome]
MTSALVEKDWAMPLKWGGLQPVYVTTMHKSPAP